jgi:hypothetical protein
MPVGVDFGLQGGLVAIDGRHIVFATKTPVFNYPLVKLEATDGIAAKHRQFLSWRSKMDQVKNGTLPKSKKPKPMASRYVETGELRPQPIALFDTEAITSLLRQVRLLAILRGYPDIFVAIEEPQTFVGKSGVKGYRASGRCDNAWLSAMHDASIRGGYVSPKHWKSTMGLGEDKNESLLLAAQKFELPDHMKDDHDLCEAALIADFIRLHASRYLTMSTGTLYDNS